MNKMFRILLSLAILLLPFNAEAKRVAIPKGYSGANYTFNLKSSNTSNLRAAWLAQSGNVILAAIGDSTTAGQSTGGGTSQAINAWPMQLASILRTNRINAGANNFFSDKGSWGQAQTIANFLTGDSRLSATGGMALGSVLTTGGNSFAVSATGTLTFTPQDSVNAAQIWWRDGASGRNFSWSVNGGSETGINSSGVTQLVRSSIALGDVGFKAIRQSWVLGAVTPIGIHAYNSNLGSELSILNWGISGATSTSLNTNIDVVGRLNMIDIVQPKGVLYEGGVINSWRTSISVATTKSDMVTMVLRIKAAGGDPILVAPPFDNSGSGLSANQNAYVNAMYQVAAEYDVPLIDIRQKWSSYANALALGYMSDSVHPTTLGYTDWAQVISKTIIAIMSNSFAANDEDAPFIPAANDNNKIIYRERKAA